MTFHGFIELAPPLPSSAPPPTGMAQWNIPHDPGQSLQPFSYKFRTECKKHLTYDHTILLHAQISIFALLISYPLLPARTLFNPT